MKQILTTNNYELFKSIDGNRNVNELHLSRLKKSIQKKYLFTFILVNEKHHIIDGQHRFEVIKELGLPLNYVVCKGYGINEVHQLNENSKNWNADDYLDGYCKLNKPEYLKYKEFKDRYQLGHNQTMSILSGSTDGKAVKTFYSGDFKIKDYKKACDLAEKIKTIGTYYKDYKRRSFINAVKHVMQNQNFDFDMFINKLKIQPGSLTNCVNAEQYIALIEDIYNFKSRNKVNLRY